MISIRHRFVWWCIDRRKQALFEGNASLINPRQSPQPIC